MNDEMRVKNGVTIAKRRLARMRSRALATSAVLFVASWANAQTGNQQAPQPAQANAPAARAPIKEADYIPVSASVPFVSFSPVVMKVPGRQVDLQMRVSAPATGSKLPILLLSHGQGYSNYVSSLRGYNPLVDFYASHGFVVIQPTHQDSKSLDLPPNGPEGMIWWRSRATDMHFILDHLDEIERTVPGLTGRLDRSRVVAVGHSAGGHTVQLLAGMRPTDPNDGKKANLTDPRVKAVVMIGARGGDTDLGPFVVQHLPIAQKVDFSEMKTPALVVAGDRDLIPIFSPRVSWRADAYPLSPGPKCLLTMFGATHSYGGIAQYDAAETSDENPERVSVLQRLSWAYLRSVLYPGDTSWEKASAALNSKSDPMGSVECK